MDWTRPDTQPINKESKREARNQTRPERDESVCCACVNINNAARNMRVAHSFIHDRSQCPTPLAF